MDRNLVKKTEFLASLSRFFSTYRYALLAALAVTLFCYGYMLTHRSLSIDEETWILNEDSSAIRLWLVQGRFGLYLFDLVFQPLGRYIPMIWDWVAVVIWQLSAVLFCHAMVRLTRSGSTYSVLIFCTVFCTVPLSTGELLSFSMFNLQQALAMLLLACSVTVAYEDLQASRRSVLRLVLSVVLLFCAISIYQAFAVVFVTAIVAYLLLKACNTSEPTIGKLALDTVFLLGIVIVAVGAYWAVNYWITTRVAPGGAGYLRDHFVGWRLGTPAWLSLARAVKSMLRVWLGWGVIGGHALVLSTLVCVGYAVAVLRMGPRKYRVHRLALLVLFQLSPFAMNLLLATPSIVGRTLLALPLALAVVFFLLLNTLPAERPFVRAIAMIAVSLVLCLNAVDMNRYFYFSHQIYRQDAAFAEQVMNRAVQQGIRVSGQPVVFIGKYDDGPALPDWGPALGSFFQWDGGNVQRMADFLRAQGYPVSRPNVQQVGSAVQLAQMMNPWPQEGCIVDAGDVLIVKLSDLSQGSSWYRINGLAP